MTILDTFNSDSFNVTSLTTALDLIPYQPNWLGNLGIFRSRGITTEVAVVEERQGKLSLVPNSARGTSTQAGERAARKTRSFICPHLALIDGIKAAEIQGVRAFGQETVVETLAGKVNEVAVQLRANIDITKEYHRHGAISGVVYDDDMSTEIYNYFTAFGVTEQTEDFVFTTATTDIKAACQSVIRKIHTALGGTMFQGIVGLAGDTWFDALIGHAEVKTAYERWLDGTMLRTLQSGGAGYFTGPDGQAGFNFAGITFYNSRAAIGSNKFIDDDQCRFFPVGVPGLFEEINAPADYIETVNTEGMDFYVKQERQAMDKGIDIEVQANPLIMPTRPRCLLKGTHS